MTSLYKITFFVPESHVEVVKMAMFSAGAGGIGNYDRCAWQVLGVGQFRPLQGSDAFVGQIGCVEKVNEYRVEMICEAGVVKPVIAEMKRVHPYEEPAFDVLKTVDIDAL